MNSRQSASVIVRRRDSAAVTALLDLVERVEQRAEGLLIGGLRVAKPAR